MQRVLAERCRAAGMLLVFDEIFAGLWRLGTPSAWQRLRVRPDIACYAKLLTGARARAPAPADTTPSTKSRPCTFELCSVT